MNDESQRVLDFMQVNIRATDIARDLTAAQQQMAEIAKVILRNAKVVVMDEPTSSLSDHEINALFTQIRLLREKNVAIIYISHRLKEIFQMCDRATVLRDGCFVTTKAICETTEKELVASMLATTNSPNRVEKLSSVLTSMPGAMPGTIMRKKVCSVEAPSTRAASDTDTMSIARMALLMPLYINGMMNTKYAPARTATSGRSVPP